MPLAPPDLASHLFLDAGRVWTPDDRFRLTTIDPQAGDVLYAAGGGMGYYTPVGAIRFDVGYKLNPTVLDVRSLHNVLEAVRRVFPPRRRR